MFQPSPVTRSSGCDLHDDKQSRPCLCWDLRQDLELKTVIRDRSSTCEPVFRTNFVPCHINDTSCVTGGGVSLDR